MKKCNLCWKEGRELYSYIVCDECKKKLRLFTEKSVQKYIEKFWKNNYNTDIENRLKSLESDYIKKKIKLLDIKEKIKKN